MYFGFGPPTRCFLFIFAESNKLNIPSYPKVFKGIKRTPRTSKQSINLNSLSWHPGGWKSVKTLKFMTVATPLQQYKGDSRKTNYVNMSIRFETRRQAVINLFVSKQLLKFKQPIRRMFKTQIALFIVGIDFVLAKRTVLVGYWKHTQKSEVRLILMENNKTWW